MLRAPLRASRPLSEALLQSRLQPRHFTALAPLARQPPDRLPHGHVRPRRRPVQRSRSEYSPYGEQYPPSGGYGQPFAPDDLDYDQLVHVPSRPVYVPHDPQGVLQDSHAARDLLAHDTLVVVRQIEMMNIFMGFEQANRYAIQTPSGEIVGFLAEEERSLASAMTRQFLRTHRPFRSVVMDRTGNPILWIRRPFQFINSKIFVHADDSHDSSPVGEAQQEWHPWRRRYNIYQARPEDTFRQFARIDGGLWAWDFWLKDKDDRLVASINRNFRGLGRELFTDTGQYVIRFDSAGTELDLPPGSGVNVQGQTLVLPEGREGGLTLDQRAMTLATAVSIDFDYFSRHSGSGGMGFPFIFWGGGDGGAEASRQPAPGGADGAGAAGAAGVAGAAGAAVGEDGRQLSEDEEIYGRQPGQYDDGSSSDYPSLPPDNYPESGGWNENEFYPDGEDVMEDPWADQQGGGGGFFGGGDGGGGGDWGGSDWS